MSKGDSFSFSQMKLIIKPEKKSNIYKLQLYKLKEKRDKS